MGFGKKLTALVLAAAMTAAACSCGTESGKSTAGEESSQAEEKPDFRTETAARSMNCPKRRKNISTS